ncbi:acetate--CoA ligase family protein, partial [bacterium]|nr:acetate--CoA ligase family protein [bacterium]
IVTNAGGPGVMATDTAVGVGLTIPHFNEETAAKLKASLPAAANMKNPVDVIGDARSDRYASALDAVLADPNVDQALVILTPQSMTDIDTIAHAVCEVHERTDKPLACSFMGATDVASGISILEAAHIPHYALPEWACKAMADVQRVRRWRERQDPEFTPLPVDRDAAAAIIDAAPPGYLPEHEALAVLEAYGIPVPEYKLCRDADEAAAYADTLGYPIVMRVVSPQVVHKFEVGGVALGMANAQEARDTYESMTARVTAAVPDAEFTGILVRPLIPEGHEVILGAKRDAAFGATVMFGLGGIFVEVFKDVNFALAPVDAATVSQMIRGVRTFPLLDGARGTAKADVASIEDSLHRLGQLASDMERITELDINPLIVADEGQGSTVADVRIRLS